MNYDDIGLKIIEEKDRSVNELRETVEVVFKCQILELKIKKLE